MRRLVKLQDEVEVAYTRMVSVTVDSPEAIGAFRAGLGARWTILSDADRVWMERLDLEEKTDPVDRPYVPTTFTLYPDLTIHEVYGGYWFWGRPTRRPESGPGRASRPSAGHPARSACGLAKLRHRNETLLSKVLVEGERFPHAFSSHDLETGPVDQRHLHRACQE